MSESKRKKVSIWKVRCKDPEAPWVFFHTRETDSYTTALSNARRQIVALERIMLSKVGMEKTLRVQIRKYCRNLRQNIDSRVLSELKFECVNQSGISESNATSPKITQIVGALNKEQAIQWRESRDTTPERALSIHESFGIIHRCLYMP